MNRPIASSPRCDARPSTARHGYEAEAPREENSLSPGCIVSFFTKPVKSVSPLRTKDRRLTELLVADRLSSDDGESDASGTSDVTPAQIASRATAAMCS